MNQWRKWACVALVCAGLGCGATLKVRRVPVRTPCIDGLATRVNAPHRVIAVFKEKPGGGTIEQYSQTVMLPSEAELYVVNYRGALFFSRELQVDLLPSTVAKRVKVGSDPQLEEALNALTAATGNAAATAAVLNPASAASVPGAQQSLKFCLEALAANRAAVNRGEALPYPDVLQCPPATD